MVAIPSVRILGNTRTVNPRGLTQVGRGHQHTPDISLCSWVQIGIEKSRSQLKLEIQRIWRDKIPIISCPPPLPVPSTPSASASATAAAAAASPQRGATGWAVGERGDWRRG